jgi:hypothetical protein
MFAVLEGCIFDGWRSSATMLLFCKYGRMSGSRR